MKFLLSMVICSSVAGECMDTIPVARPHFNSQYDCLMEGIQTIYRKNGRDRTYRCQQI